MPWCRLTHRITFEEDPGHLGSDIARPGLIVKEHGVDKVARRGGVDVKESVMATGPGDGKFALSRGHGSICGRRNLTLGTEIVSVFNTGTLVIRNPYRYYSVVTTMYISHVRVWMPIDSGNASLDPYCSVSGNRKWLGSSDFGARTRRDILTDG